MNSDANCSVIRAADKAGVKRIVVLGAHLPFLLRTDKFGYSKGKRLTFEAAQAFAAISSGHSAVVMQPNGIIGTRYKPNGKAIHLETVMNPVIKFQRFPPRWVQWLLPESLVTIEEVARMAAYAALSPAPYSGKLTVISNREIIVGPDR